MSAYTKEELRALLANHGVELPSTSAKKEELIALYEEFVEPIEKSKGEFSSDDEEVVLSSNATKKKTSRKSSRPSTPAKSSSERSQIIIEEVVTGETLSSVGDVVDDLNLLTDDQLATRLRQFEVDVGPIVESTRSLYIKKLSKLQNPVAENSTLNGSSIENGDSSATENGEYYVSVPQLKNGDFSADEVTEEDDDEQPSVIIRKAATPVKRSSARTSAKAKGSPLISPLKDIGSSFRQRFSGASGSAADVTDSGRGGRFTPTPRRSIHSYKVTETTTQSMIKSADGNVSHDFAYTKETSESTSEAGKNKLASVLRFLPKFFFLLILIVVAYYVYTEHSQQIAAFFEVKDDQEQAPAVEVEPAQLVEREPAPDQDSIANV